MIGISEYTQRFSKYFQMLLKMPEDVLMINFSEDFQTLSHDILQTLAQPPQHSRPQSIASDSARKELSSLPGCHAQKSSGVEIVATGTVLTFADMVQL